VTYDRKHNDANGEDNRDGSDDNHNWNCGHEGETGDPLVGRIRSRAVRGMLGSLILSAGVPMLGHGDEIGRTQRGNNNAYCQDNELAWVDWSSADAALLDFTRSVIALRHAHPVFRRRTFFTGSGLRPGGAKDIAWFSSDGEEMASSDWYDLRTRTIGMYLSGKDIHQVGQRGEPIIDDSFLVLLHAGLDATTFTLPAQPWATSYEVLVDNVEGANVEEARGIPLVAGLPFNLPALAFVVLRAS
jgi:isoamylase